MTRFGQKFTMRRGSKDCRRPKIVHDFPISLFRSLCAQLSIGLSSPAEKFTTYVYLIQRGMCAAGCRNSAIRNTFTLPVAELLSAQQSVDGETTPALAKWVARAPD